MIGKALNWFGQDGLAHILVSLILCAVLAAFMPVWIAALVAIAIGFIKELVWDKLLKKGTAEWRDIIADAVGVLLGVFIIILYASWN